jgi:polyferredoxin
MKLPAKLTRFLQTPRVTYPRIGAALAVAVVTDAVEFASGFFGWVGLDQVLDVVAMIAIGRLIGFHILFLPTFVLEAAPLADEFPTWTACVIAVSFLRRREQRRQDAPPPLP